MKTFLSILVLLLGVFAANAQTVKGKVYRANSDTAVANAIIYYGGSTVGTIADEQGNFELVAKPQQIPVVVSCVGYYSSTVYYQPGKPLLVHLKPKMEDLHTVVIRADGMDRKGEIAMFIREFLGTSNYAHSCTIENMDDINLFYDKKTLTLTADCDKPIIIHNKKLGYAITYYLDRFKVTPSETGFAGNYIFKEDTAGIGQDWVKIAANREQVYAGSRMQFIRALWHNMLDKAGFKIFIDSWVNPVSAKSIVILDSAKQRYVHFEGELLVTRPTVSRHENPVFQKQKYVFIDKSGYYGLGLQWAGPMASQRIGDLLPFEFQSEKEIKLYGEPDVNLTQAAQPGIAATFPAKPVETIIPIEKAYLHTDRDVYTQREDIWFKAYLLNGRDNTPVTVSRLLHVELIDPAAKVVASRLLRLEDGLTGDFKLSDTISPGAYRIRAYTNWMRNFGDDFIFEKNIRIQGAVKINPATAAIKKNKKTATATPATVASTAPPTVRFFPEGGAMINGLSSIVAVRAEDAHGHGLPATGKVVDNNDQVVAGFTCDSMGFGAFTLLPDTLQHYQALVTMNGENSRFILPGVLPQGFTLHAQAKGEMTVISIACNDRTFNKAKGQQLLLTAKHGGLTLIKKVIPLNSGQLLVNLPDDLLPEGIAVITLSDEKATPLCERLVYIQHPGSKPLTVSIDQPTYRPKQKTTVSLKLNTPGIAHLSLAAVDAGTVPVQPENIVTYLNLQSEIKGHIEKAERYFDTTNVNRFKQMDLLLLTQGWRGFVWKRLEDTTLNLHYKAEQGIDITGNVRKVWVNKPVPGVTVLMNAPKADGQHSFVALTDSTGRFTIRNAVFYGYQYIDFFARKADEKGVIKDNSGGEIHVDSIFQDRPPVKPAVVLPDTTYNNAEAESIIEALRRKLNLKADRNLKEVKIKASTSKVDVELPPQIHPITLTEQKEYFDLTQYLLYMIDGARLVYGQCRSCTDPLRIVRNKKGKEMIMSSGEGGSRFLIPARINAVYTDQSPIDTCNVCQEQYLNQPMKNILKVTITPIQSVMGMTYKVDLILRPGVLENNDYFDNTMADMIGYYRAREFYKPKPEELDNNIDTRVNTIHWEPNISTDENGEATISYLNLPQKSGIRLVVQGVSESGVPLAATTGYNVN